MKVLAYVGLGANLGDMRQSLEHALAELAALPASRLGAVSGAYRSAPVDAEGPDYLNAVAVLETELAPLALLDALQARFGTQFSNTPQQHWVSLLMPPRTNFYQQAELFPVFAQHIDFIENPLSHLHQLNGQPLGSLSFANPDNPVVTPPLRSPPRLAAGYPVVTPPLRSPP
eukprot:gene12182-15511_t